MSLHADTILAATTKGDATSAIATSWRRCATLHRLDPDGFRPPDRDALILRETREREAKLIAIATPFLDELFTALDDPLGGVSLVERSGLMVALRVGGTQDVEDSRPERWLGASVSEASIGTNGNGTCLVEERPVIVSGQDHFLSMLTHTVCIAAPIFGPDGGIVASLNALTSVTNPGGRRLAAFAQIAVKSLAQRVEAELFAAAFPNAHLMLASDLGRNPGALLSVDRDGIVLGATRAARRLLALEAGDLARGIDIETLRGSGPSEHLAESERRTIVRALARHDGNVTRAARSLGISRSTLYRKAVGAPHAPG